MADEATTKLHFNAKDLTGMRVGRMTVIGIEGRRRGYLLWRVRCDCGNEKLAVSGELTRGRPSSCGCGTPKIKPRPPTHGLTKSSTYNIWKAMRRRCGSKREKDYRNYGARGIVVCERWLKFENFLADMGKRPSPKHSIDRIDNDGNYEPGNCRWATNIEQSNNTRVNRVITAEGVSMTMAEWARHLGVSYHAIRWRVQAGVDGEAVIRHFMRQ